MKKEIVSKAQCSGRSYSLIIYNAVLIILLCITVFSTDSVFNMVLS